MVKRKAPKTWAEEIADLDDPAPKDLDPEQLNDGNSGEDDSEEGTAQAREHYVEVGSSKLRKPVAPALGPKYSGTRISRYNFFDPTEESDDDPFASAQSRQESSSDAIHSEEYADPGDVDLDLDKAIDEDDEIDSDEAFGDGDDERFRGYAFRGGGRAQANSQHEEDNDHIETEEVNEESNGFSDMESEGVDATEAGTDVNGHVNGLGSTDIESGQDGDDIGDMEMEDQESLSSEADGSRSEATSSDTGRSSAPPSASDDRAALRRMMAESQKVITLNLSKAAKSDIAKGRAIRQQRTAFDSLLNTRIRLQKALVAANSLATSRESTSQSSTADPAVEAAEKAALRLWSTLDSLRQSITPQAITLAPKPLEAEVNTPLSTLWTRMRFHDTQYHDYGLKTLNKWSLKTAPISSLPRTNKFSSSTTQQPLSKVLEQQLSSSKNMEKLIAKTRMPRSCTSVQAATLSSKNRNPNTDSPGENSGLPIYDDADFYSLLLRDLLDSRSSLPNPTSTSTTITSTSVPLPSATIPGIKDPALRIHKKSVDTKASKGRKMKYTVHEKLQNFMAPEDRGSWGERQRSELFAGLLGRKVVGLDEEGDGMDEDVDVDGEQEGLRLFRR
ncbi:MAG: hypothetical protein Q9181_002426 [Wetmoreana brouardii]